MGCTHPPHTTTTTTTEKQTAGPPLILNLSPRLPCLSPRGGAWGIPLLPPPSGGGVGWWALRGLLGVCGGEDSRSPPSMRAPPHDRGKRTRDAEDGEGLGTGTHPAAPLPHRVPCPPAEAACEARRAAPAAARGEGEARRDARPRRPPRGPSTATCPPSATYRGSSGSQGRGRSSSERSVRPTVPLKGAGANQRAREESGGGPAPLAASPAAARTGPSPLRLVPRSSPVRCRRKRARSCDLGPRLSPR